jgi:hypothetical protein
MGLSANLVVNWKVFSGSAGAALNSVLAGDAAESSDSLLANPDLSCATRPARSLSNLIAVPGS